MIIFKEYTVKFEDSGRYYNVSVCRGFPKSRAFAAKSDKPDAMTMTAIRPVSIRTSTWKELMYYYQHMVKRSVHRLKRHLAEKRRKKRC